MRTIQTISIIACGFKNKTNINHMAHVSHYQHLSFTLGTEWKLVSVCPTCTSFTSQVSSIR